MQRREGMSSGAAAQRLEAWYAGRLGTLLWEQERAQLEASILNLFGYHVVQLGSLGADRDDDLLGLCRIPHRIVLDPVRRTGIGLVAVPDALPIASDSVDAVLLPHTLEFVDDPHQVLREVDRVLVAEGHVVILGFNPWGSWGWRRLFGSRAVPWCGRFFSQTRIRDWLALLGFDPIVGRGCFFRPPLEYEGVMRRIRFIECLGRRGGWSFLAAAYVLVARKRVAALTPIRSRWQPRRRLVTAGLARPSARVVKRGG